jgi:2-iminoacetate synthase ThiH
VRDFLEQSHMWTEEPILEDDSRVLLDVEAVQAEVDDYAQKAYKAAKANKDVSFGSSSSVYAGHVCLQSCSCTHVYSPQKGSV